MTEARDTSHFSIGLFEVGELPACLYSYFCTVCAVADARTYLDESDCLFNCYCLNMTTVRLIAFSLNFNLDHF